MIKIKDENLGQYLNNINANLEENSNNQNSINNIDSTTEGNA